MNSLSTVILAIHSNVRMDQISVDKYTKTLVDITNTKTLVKSINSYPFKDTEPHKPHTWKKDCTRCGLNKKGVRKLVIQHDIKLENCPFRRPLLINKIHPENSSLRIVTRMDNYQRNSIKTLIHPTKLLLRIQLLAIEQK